MNSIYYTLHFILHILYIYIYIYISVATGLRTDTFGFRSQTDTCFKKKIIRTDTDTPTIL